MTSAYTRAKRILFGQPLASDRLEDERLNKKTALAVLSSDAISSVAYATDQILFVVGGALGAASLTYVLPISAVIVGLLVLVGISYSQTILAYPGGGGSYTVAKENLGPAPGLVAAAALLTDYILTVAVSISSGVAAITSAYPSLLPQQARVGRRDCRIRCYSASGRSRCSRSSTCAASASRAWYSAFRRMRSS
jgi:amino acid transporter